MCPLAPFHLLLLYICLLLPFFLAVVEATDSMGSWNMSFNQVVVVTDAVGNFNMNVSQVGDVVEGEVSPVSVVRVREEELAEVEVSCHGCVQKEGNTYVLNVVNDHEHLAYVQPGDLHEHLAHVQPGDFQDAVTIKEAQPGKMFDINVTSLPPNWSLPLNISGVFLGFGRVSARVVMVEKEMASKVRKDVVKSHLDVIVMRSKAKKKASKMFGYSVAALVSIAYINMGAALDLSVVKAVLLRPVGPAIGFVCQFVLMPVLAFLLSYIFSSPSMKLGLFVTGISPGGGASNMWTLLLGGNLDLSVTMTAVSTLAAFAMMPLWLAGLGEIIIADTLIVVPYTKIISYGIMMIVPLSIGICITRFLPKVSKVLVKMMKPLALLLILFILVFGIWSQFYMFSLMDWRVLVAGFLLPWFGFSFGCLVSRVVGRSKEDIIAIAVETGVQNTGMAIFMLWFTLEHPAGDLAAVVPVAVATMTPLPLLTALVYYKLRDGSGNKEEDLKEENVDEKLVEKLIAEGENSQDPILKC